MSATFTLVCVPLLNEIVLRAAAFRADKALWKTELKEKFPALFFRIEFLLKIYDTQLTFMIFSCRHNAFPLFSLLCLYYITLSVRLSGLLGC
jgi:hypothetical protein